MRRPKCLGFSVGVKIDLVLSRGGRNRLAFGLRAEHDLFLVRVSIALVYVWVAEMPVRIEIDLFFV